ncbi:MAG: hypothetical protein P8Z41_01770 [Anaerolineales bacterium]|jgi:hypothetical protein
MSMRLVFRTWWPLALSWMLMALELPVIGAAIARLPDPQINLAAWGGIVYPLALIVEAPIIMLLSASTALSKDWDSYLRIRKYMLWMAGGLTLLHVLVAFTPLYDLVVVRWIDAPAEIVEPARLGLRLLLPWTGAIAYRRFQQGVLIRCGHSGAVGTGTIVRLAADVSVIALGLITKRVSGIALAGLAMSSGVMSEALFNGLRVRPVLRDQLRHAPPAAEALSLRSFLSFYVPLAMTSLLFLLIQPLGSAALSRMPQALESLAAWPVVSGLVFLLRSPGVAFNEVAVALLDEPDSGPYLVRFALRLMGVMSVLLLLIVLTPISMFWFEKLTSLDADLARMAANALWFTLPLPAISVLVSWFQGVLLNARRTHAVTESVIFGLIVISSVLVSGVVWGQAVGLYVGWLAFSLGMTAQVTWLWWRSRRSLSVLMHFNLQTEQDC